VLAPAASCADQQLIIAAQAAEIAELRRQRLGTPGFTPGHGLVTCCGYAGDADETCAEMRRVNDAQAARIAQLEAELRACSPGMSCRRCTFVACCRLHAAWRTL
jgi:hypothetical protein